MVKQIKEWTMEAEIESIERGIKRIRSRMEKLIAERNALKKFLSENN